MFVCAFVSLSVYLIFVFVCVVFVHGCLFVQGCVCVCDTHRSHPRRDTNSEGQDRETDTRRE